jgi:hypothetical protein
MTSGCRDAGQDDARAVLPEGTVVPGRVPAEIFAAAVPSSLGSGWTCGHWPGASA